MSGNRIGPAGEPWSCCRALAAGLTGLSEGQREQAMTRWRLLAPHFQDGVPLAWIAGQSGVGVAVRITVTVRIGVGVGAAAVLPHADVTTAMAASAAAILTRS